MSSLLKQNSCSKSSHLQLFRLSVETPTSKVLVYDLLAILEKQDAEQLQVFKAKCDKAVVAESDYSGAAEPPVRRSESH